MAGARIQLKRATASQWTSANTVLFAGEIGYETDTNKFKIGDGTAGWTSLSYFNGNLSGSNLNDLLDVTITSAANGDFLRWNGSAWINDAVNLSTDTVGSYVESLVAGTGVTVTNNSGEGAAPTIAIGQSVATNTTPTFAGLTLNGNITFEGTTADEFETIIAVTDPTSDRVIVFPDLTGTVVTSGDTGTVTSLMIADGTIVNADINASAAIDKTKISGTAITAGDTGTVTSTMISDGTIVNGDINASAAIALSKLASGTSAQVVVADASGVPTYATLTGDVTISSTGVTSIAANSVALGTDTTGNYVNDVTAGTGVTVTHTPGEGSSPTVAIGQSVATSASPTFANVTISSVPTDVNHAATKAYVDYLAAGIVWHDAVKLATAAVLPGTPTYDNGTSGIGATLTATANARLMVDGTNATTNDRVLVKDQADATQNGVYTVTTQGSVSVPYVLTRATDFDASASYEKIGASGDAVYVTSGAYNPNQGFITLSTGTGTDGTYVIGTDSITFGQFTGTATFIAGNGVTITGNTINVESANAGRIVVGGDSIDLALVTRTNTSGTAGKSFVQSFATDSYGRVTGAVTADTAITLGTDTSGDYVASLVAGTGITLTSNTGETATPTVAVTANTYDAYGASSTVAGNLTTHANLTEAHGATGAVVGTTNTQTLTNKTLTSPKVNEDVVLSSTATELNILDGATLSTTELNYVDGVTSAIQTQLDAKAPLASPTFTGTVSGITKTMVGLGNVDNTADTAKPVSTAQQTALDLKANLASPTFTGTVTIPTGASITAPNMTRPVIAAQGGSEGGEINLASPVTGTSISGGLNIDLVNNSLRLFEAGGTNRGLAIDVTTLSASAGSLIVTTDTTQTLTNKTLTSPTLTGTPTLPTGTIATTQTALDSTTKVATTAFVTTADNLKANLASPTFTGTVTIPAGASISGFAPLASPALTGTPISTTAAVDTNTTQIATTAYVVGQGYAKLAGATFTGAVSGTSLTLSGDLIVNGTTTTINSTTIAVDDKNIELGSVASPTDASADGGGITLKGATDKTLNWIDATDAWTSSEDFNLLTGKVYEINGTAVLSSTQVLGKTLPSGTVVGTSDTQTLTNKTLTSPTLGTSATVSGGTLVSTAATVLTPLSITANTGNSDNLLTTITRDATGSDWTTSTWMIQRKVDATNMGFVEFGASSVTLGNNVTEVMTVTGTEVLFNKPIVFEGATADGFETTLTVVDPTADRTITLPNVTGTVVTTGDTGTVTSAMITDATIVNADISTTAAIDLGKLADISTNAQTANYTLVLADKNKLVEMSVASGNTLTVPPNSSVAFPVGSQIRVLQTNTGQCTLTAGAGVTVNATPGLKLRTQWASATLIKRATDTWVAVGDLSA